MPTTQTKGSNIIKQIVLFSSIFLLAFASGFSCEDCSEQEFGLRKIQVSAESITIQNEGIFVELEGFVLPAFAIEKNAVGFIATFQNIRSGYGMTCPLEHPTECLSCYGCSWYNFECPFRCRCNEY